MSFPYTTLQIREIVQSPKVLRHPELLEAGEPIPFENYGERGKRIDLHLDLVDGPALVDLRFHIRGPVFDNPETYEAALILYGERVRGIGWHATGKKRYYGKEVIPKGWHQNAIDPTLPPGHPDRDPHPPLDAFAPTDLTDFFTKAAKVWHINLQFNEGLL